ncbi:MAG: molecular chaperone HtpG [Candidatus Izemoplasmataceae bacterium]
MAKTKQFKTESKKLLNLMINSIYTHKEIFLRELISNASDAIDKRHYLSLTDEQVPSEDAYTIQLDIDEENRTLSITDNGIGLTEEELINNLGTIAESGSKSFLEKLEKKDVEMIGQFGVGFYSAFMVASEVTLITKSPYSDKAYKWVSKGESSYTIDVAEKETIGTTIQLKLRDDDEEKDENYTEYLKPYTIKNLVKKYSDYVRYPIQMLETEKDEKDKVKTTLKTLNSMVPIWKKSKNDLTEEALNDFYKHQFNDFENPIKTIHTSVEGLLTYTALLFIPEKPSYDFYTEKFEKGLQLYSKGVFIMDKNKDLLPDHFRFVKGLVDSADLSLNISREMLQHDRQLKKIAAHVEKKIKSELEKMLKNDREKYVKFYEAYGINLKYGIYDQFGLNKELLQDLIMFKTSKSDDFITLSEYLERKSDTQKNIYYATGKTKSQILSLPQMDALKEKDYEVLLFTDDIDEFMIQIMQNYQEVPFKSIQQGESDLLDETKQEDLKGKEKEHKNLLKALKKALGDQVKDVKLSGRLNESPVCLVSGEGLSLEMEKILKQMPNQTDIKADKILEINPNHELFQALNQVYAQDASKINDYASLLYHQALLIEGLPIENPVAFSNLMVKLMIDSSKK